MSHKETGMGLKVLKKYLRHCAVGGNELQDLARTVRCKMALVDEDVLKCILDAMLAAVRAEEKEGFWDAGWGKCDVETSLFADDDMEVALINGEKVVSVDKVAQFYGTPETKSLQTVQGFEGNDLVLDSKTSMRNCEGSAFEIHNSADDTVAHCMLYHSVNPLIELGLSKGLSGALGLGRLLWASGPLEDYLPVISSPHAQYAFQQLLASPLVDWTEPIAIQRKIGPQELEDWDHGCFNSVDITGWSNVERSSKVDYAVPDGSSLSVSSKQDRPMTALGSFAVSDMCVKFLSYVNGTETRVDFPNLEVAQKMSQMDPRVAINYYQLMWYGLFPYVALFGDVLIGEKFRSIKSLVYESAWCNPLESENDVFTWCGDSYMNCLELGMI